MGRVRWRAWFGGVVCISLLVLRRDKLIPNIRKTVRVAQLQTARESLMLSPCVLPDQLQQCPVGLFDHQPKLGLVGALPLLREPCISEPVLRVPPSLRHHASLKGRLASERVEENEAKRPRERRASQQ